MFDTFVEDDAGSGSADSATPAVGKPDPLDELSSEAIAEAPELLPGTLVGGRYAVEGLVAKGGMGAVYAARDRVLGRKVALKRMLGTAVQADGDFAERFEREARVLAAVNHPNCAAVHDFGEDEHGQYLVIEWVEGQTLAALVAASGPLSPERAAGLIAQVCDGLSEVHARGFVHRDIKPQNIMVARTASGEELVKLVDFGIARPIAPGDSQLTGVGCSLGSPPYMSPEQRLAEPATVASDVYSAGATLFFALAGRQPFLGDRVSILHQVLRAAAPDLPWPLRRHPLQAVVKQAMARDPGGRPPSAGSLAERIRACGRRRGLRWLLSRVFGLSDAVSAAASLVAGALAARRDRTVA